MKYLLLAALLLGPTLASTFAPERPAPAPKLYLCNGGQSYAYHSTPHCQGLEYCSTNAQAVTQAQAEKQHRRPCRRCH